MTLKINQKVQAEIRGDKLTVKKKLGEGSQGEVFLAQSPRGDMALKWYNNEFSTKDQKNAIKSLVNMGPPKNSAGKRFVWPLDVATVSSCNQFGYLMPLIDTKIYAQLGEIQSGKRQQPNAKSLCEIGYQLANSYRALHLTGCCYRDISGGNLVFNPETGDVLICDNDNVGVNGHSSCQIQGTMEYMAPEIIMGKADPSTDTDLYSLAILLFNIWMWHHPMHGDHECSIHVWDLPAKKRIYGENPLFIFDPRNFSNRPNDPDYGTVRKRWQFCPNALKQAFIKSFSVGLNEPGKRITEGEWQSLFLQLQDGILRCQTCNAENIWDETALVVKCWHCGSELIIPPKLLIKTSRGNTKVLLTYQMKLQSRHIDALCNVDETDKKLADLVQHPQDHRIWGLRNLTSQPWTAVFPDGSKKEVPPQRSVSLNIGTRINIQGTETEIIR